MEWQNTHVHTYKQTHTQKKVGKPEGGSGQIERRQKRTKRKRGKKPKRSKRGKKEGKLGGGQRGGKKTEGAGWI